MLGFMIQNSQDVMIYTKHLGMEVVISGVQGQYEAQNEILPEKSMQKQQQKTQK